VKKKNLSKIILLTNRLRIDELKAGRVSAPVFKERNGMATGRSNKLVGQTGEYLVAAELSRRGLIATTFTGNVPHYDIIASNEKGKHVSVQVKASRGSSWQFGDITKFCDIEFKGKRQIVGKAKRCPVQDLVMVFVVIDINGADRYYILTWRKLRDLMVKSHKAYLTKHSGIRPVKWESFHSAISEDTLKRHKDNWAIIERNLR
jgi:hypothetical protein